MIVHDSAAHKPEALAKGHGILRLRLRLVCCIIPHGYFSLNKCWSFERLKVPDTFFWAKP